MAKNEYLEGLDFLQTYSDASGASLYECTADLLGERDVKLHIATQGYCTEEILNATSLFLKGLEGGLPSLRLQALKAMANHDAEQFVISSIGIVYDHRQRKIVHAKLGISVPTRSIDGTANSSDTYIIMMSEHCDIWFIERSGL